MSRNVITPEVKLNAILILLLIISVSISIGAAPAADPIVGKVLLLSQVLMLITVMSMGARLIKRQLLLLRHFQEHWYLQRSAPELLNILAVLTENWLSDLAPKAWNKTCESFLDPIHFLPEEITYWKEREFDLGYIKFNLKYVAYMVLVQDLMGFIFYFMKTIIAEVIATRQTS